MAIKEQDKVFYEELANGDKVINLPVTRANNVEGLGRSANTAYVVGDVVYVDNNKKVALKCTTAGTTSADELDVNTANIGDTVADGSVVWQVCNRTSDVTSVNGKTGDVVVGEVANLSISGKTITVTFADGTTKTLTTQDNGYHTGNATSIGGASATKPAVVVESYRSGTSWYRVYSDGWIEQGGYATGITNHTGSTITLLKAMADTDYHVLGMNYKSTNTVALNAICIKSKATSSMVLSTSAFDSNSLITGVYWYVCGKGA